MDKTRGEIGLILVSIIWGSGFIASAIGLDYLSAYETLAGRFLVAAVLLTAVNRKKLKKLQPKTIKNGILLGIFLYGAFVLQTVGLEYTTPSKNAFLTAVNVAVVPFIGFLFHKTPLDRNDVLRASLAMVGVALISLNWTGILNLGDVLSFLCAFAFALHIFYTGEFMENEDPLSLTMVQMITAFVLGMFFMVMRGESLLYQDRRGYLAMIYLGVFSTTIAFLMMSICQKYTKSSRAAVIMSTESLFAMVFSIIILNEEVTPRMILGAIVIFTAIVLPQGKEEDMIAETLEKDAV
ncbi:DMT family transporter [Proteiniclasticum sp.]|uniref:DMT family transporter n=1 Tax=Proteiniclasticum sp. TaxID=2053595 RepID=UPI00289ED2A6|nr:DMT family transporter [Proteiniclasticum sp.]